MSKNNLFNSEAIEKLKELAESIDFTVMSTNLSKFPIEGTPMSTKKVCDAGDVWFLSGKDSQHNKNIHKDSIVCLTYINKASMEFMIVNGEASISQDKNIIDELYSKSDDIWFKGKDDPNVTVIKVEPLDVKYWDTKHNKIVTLIKMASSFIKGEQPTLMDHGHLNIRKN